MFKFLHAADIHLDSPRSGLDLDPDAPASEIRQAPRRSLENIVQLAIDEQVDFVLIAGDLYDGDWKDFRTGLFFVEQMARLNDARIPVFMVAGNHDAANRMTKTLKLPNNVKTFSDKKAETVHLEELGVAIHGRSFAKAAETEDLSLQYPAPVPGQFNIGLLHTCATKSGEHERYAPCTIEGLVRKGHAYWALGHIHTRDVMHADPHIVFPGNIQGRHIRETGAKGCVLVTVADNEQVSLDFRATDVLRWERCDVDANDAEDAYEVVERVSNKLKELAQLSDGRPLAVRVEVHGPTPAHHELAARPKYWNAEIEAVARQITEVPVWIERVTRRTSLPLHLEVSQSSEGPIGELVRFIEEARDDEGCLAALAKELDHLQQKLPPEITERRDEVRLNSPAGVNTILDDVRHLLSYRLTGEGTSNEVS
jgi:DNA repair exonuclease SbcCD nuclease subunit